MSITSISPASQSSNQLSLFSVQFDSRIRRTEINGATYFSILDTFQFHGDKGNPTQAWKTTLVRLKKQGFDQTPIVGDWRPDGQKGGKGTPMATLQTFLRIAQSTEFENWESIRNWMADVAHERLEEMITPGLGTQRARERDLALLEKQGLGKSAAAEFLQDRIEGVDPITGRPLIGDK